MKLLLVGSDSQIGLAVTALLQERGVSYEKLSNSDALKGNLKSLEKKYRQEKINFVVNVDHIDGFEGGSHGQQEFEIRHILLPQQLAKLAEALEVPLLQLSDYQVFSGTHDKPYIEEDEPHSQTFYGVTRWQGELSVQRFCHRYIILRVGTLFCEDGTNLLTDMLTRWKQGERYSLSTRLQFSPTPTNDVARVIYAVLQQLACDVQAWGVYHYCSADTATPYDFAEVVLAGIAQFSDAGTAVKITPHQGEAGQRKSKSRGAQSETVNHVLRCKKILNTFGIRQRPWRGELTEMIENLSQKKRLL